MNVAIFDSGVGGFSVLAPLLKSNLFENIYYLGDTARVPYGNKDKEIIIRYAIEAVKFFKNFKKIDLMVVACNSVSAYAVEEIKKRVEYPVFDVIEAGVEAMKKRGGKNLIIATKATIKSGIYQKYLDGFFLATPLFVPIVEEGIRDKKIIFEVFRYYFKDINRAEIDNLLLGCTHFPYLKSFFEEYFFNASIIDSATALLDLIKRRLIFKKKFRTKVKVFLTDINYDSKRAWFREFFN